MRLGIIFARHKQHRSRDSNIGKYAISEECTREYRGRVRLQDEKFIRRLTT